MNTIFVKDANIVSVNANKINIGELNTNKVKIKSDDGGIEIVGATQQFKDKNNKVRIQMGKDVQGNFNFIIRGEDGTTTLIDHTGVKEKAIADDLIKSNMIACDAVGEKQIDYNSFSKGFNKDTNTTTLKATKIKLDNQNQTLDVAFNKLKTQSDETKSITESHSTTIGVMQGQISTAINNTQIVKDGQTVLLKDDYNRTVQTIDSMSSTIGSHTTQINQANGKISSVETKVNTVERNLDSITARVSSNETNITNVNNSLTINQQTKMNGQELLPQGYKTNSDVGYISDYKKLLFQNNQIEVTGRDFIRTDFIKFDRTKILYWFIDITCSSNNLFYFGVERYDKDKKVIEGAVNQATIYFWTGNGLNGARENWWQESSKETAYIRLRVLCDWNGTGTATTIIKNLSWKQLNSIINEQLATEITTTNNKVSAIEVNLNSITSKVSSIETTTSTINGKLSNLSTRMNLAEEKITDSSIISTVSSQFYSKGETDSKYTTQSQLTQLINSFEFKFTNNTNDNLLKNSAFLNGTSYWGINGIPSVTPYHDGNFQEGNSIRMECTLENQGIFQHGIDCSTGVAIRVYANASRPVDIRFGIEGVLTQVVRIGDGSWKELKLIVPPTAKTAPFIFYTRAGAAHTVYANRFKVQRGNTCSPWSGSPEELYSTITKIDIDGVHIDCTSTNSKVDIDTNGLIVTEKSTGIKLMSALGDGITVRGGKFYVDHPSNGYTLLWGRDIVINGGRALVGTNSNPESPLIANKLYLNYNGDFVNGIEIGGKLTNNGKDVLSQIDFGKQENGYIRLTNGLIIQWGRLSASIANGDTVQATVGFPISFPTKCCSISATITGVDGRGDLAARYNGSLKVENNSYGVFFARNVTPEKWGSTMEISYMAIGY